MNPEQYCRHICQKSGSNFVKTFYFLPRPRRLGFEAFYAFCRLVDDAVDEAPSSQVATAELKGWSQEIQNIYNGTPRHPVGQALVPVVQRFQVDRQYLEEIVAGCEMDLHKNSYQTFDELQTYCYRVASCVGLVSLYMFEAELSEKSRQAAIHLGTAVQLTNILRDVTGDLERNRFYLPLEDLEKYHVRVEDFRHANSHQDKLLTLIQFQIARARHFYDKAWNDFPSDRKQKRRLLAAHMMGKIYENILNKIARDPLRILREKVRLSNWTKLRISGHLVARMYWPL